VVSPTIVPTTIAPPQRPSTRGLALMWLGTALALSWAVWAIDGSFYGSFDVPVGRWPAWTLLDALLGPSALLAYVLVGVLWVCWDRRKHVLAGALAVATVLAAGSYLWVQHEADRARAGTPVWPSSLMPLSFSARAVTLLPIREPLPPDLPAKVLLLRNTPGIGTAVVYDPSGRRLWTLDERLVALATGEDWG
jgi:hypothetical protein